MFLKALTLKGFKSFADPVTMSLEPGVTVVVGPNGSGKSNVVDAIAWVLGAQAPSAVRSQKMDDVIFAGTAKRPALGRAEVTLTIDNSQRLLPIEFTEVTLSRTLFRTGESEYAINGAPCRLLDIQELLSDSGVGRQQHVIVSQGQIDAVLNARPEERRSIVEEAAGVLKFRKRKEKAERRLEATEGNLLRVQDLLREVRRQLRPLERQAEAARRHGDLICELNALRVYVAGRELAALRGRLQASASSQQQLRIEEREVRGELTRFDTEVLTAEAQLAATGGADVSDALRRVEQLRERARGLLALLAERRRGVERDRGRLLDTGLVATLEAEAAQLRAELTEVDASAALLAPAEQELAAEEAALARARADVEAEQPELVLTAGAASAAADVRGELRTRRGALEKALVEAARLDQRLSDLADRAARLEAAAASYREACAEAEALEHPLVSNIGAAEARRARAVAELGEAEAALQSAQQDHAAWTARAEALAMALDQARARAGAERLAGVDGVVGTLLELVDVDAGWEAAFEAAAGEALTAVVVDGVPAAKRALAHLHRGDAAGAVLALGGRAVGGPPPVGDPVRRHVRAADAAVGRLLDTLVGRAVAVDDGWEGALDVSLAHPDAVVVTRAGDRFSAGGWRLKVAGTGATGAALEEARSRVAAAEAAVADRERIVVSARVGQRAAAEEEAALVRRLDDNDARFTAATEALGRTQAERRDVATEADALAATRAELGERLAPEQARVAELEALLPALEADESAEADTARARQLARAAVDERSAALAARRRDLAVQAAGIDERRSLLRRRLAEVDGRLVADTAARTDAEHQRVNLERSLTALDRLAALVQGHHHVVDERHRNLVEQRQRQSEAARAVAQHLDAVRRDRHAAEQRLEG
ncbi:MAG TPA: AAA family ATPase, partial [Acidimicrobiales bacterium]